MEVLPKDTYLGRLRFFEIYVQFYGPKCFSVKDELDHLHLVYWSGDYDDYTCTKWVYAPVSTAILDELLREERTFHSVFQDSKRLKIISTYDESRGQPTSIEDLTELNLASVNLPPEGFSIDLEEVQSIDPESNWDFNLRIAKRSSHISPSDDAVSKVLSAFGDIVKLLMKDEHHKKRLILINRERRNELHSKHYRRNHVYRCMRCYGGYGMKDNDLWHVVKILLMVAVIAAAVGIDWVG